MAAAVVTLKQQISPGIISGKYVTDGSPAATNVNLGFVPSRVDIFNATDGNQFCVWTAEMADGTCLKNNAGTQTKVGSGGITPVAQTDGTNHGFLVGTDGGINTASKTYSFTAYR